MLQDQTAVDSFREFAVEVEPRLRQALTAALGSEPGKDAAAEALAYAWENWDRVASMGNPVGYLFTVGRNRGRRWWRGGRRVFYLPLPGRVPWVEPGLPVAVSRLPDRQREVVVLLFCFEWTMSEIAEVLDISKSTVQNHAERGLASLRKSLGVEL